MKAGRQDADRPGRHLGRARGRHGGHGAGRAARLRCRAWRWCCPCWPPGPCGDPGRHGRRAAPPPSPGPGPARGPARQARRAVGGPARPPGRARGGPRRRRGSQSAAGYLTRKAAARWQNREHRPLMFTRHSGPAPQTPAGTAGPAAAAAGPLPAPAVRHRPRRRIPPPERTTTMADTIINDDTTGPAAGVAGSRRRTAPGTPRPGPAGPSQPNGPG